MSFSHDLLDLSSTAVKSRIQTGRPANPVPYVFHEVMRQVSRSDQSNPYYTGASWSYTVGSTAGLASRAFSASLYLPRIAASANWLGAGLTIAGFLYSSFGSGGLSGDVREVLYRRDDRNLYLQPRERLSIASIQSATRDVMSSGGGTYYEAFLRVKSKLGFPSDFSYGDFKSALYATNLVSSYNSLHPHSRISDAYRRGDIGGVATDVGIIAGLKNHLPDVLSVHPIFCLRTADGRPPCTDLELREIMRTVARGIFVHDTVPFFSLHFNKNAILYPVIHPAYKNTLVGKIIALLDYYMKCYLNGGFFGEEFLASWDKEQNSESSYLKSHIIDFKKYSKEHKLEYMSLREAMSLQFLESVGLDSKASESTMKFDTSFRIIAQQKSMQYDQDNNIFEINPDFRVEYTIEPTAEYKDELDRYFELHGSYPKEYQKIEKLYQQMAYTIKHEMPKLPFLRPYFQKLGLISFFSYYFLTLKDMGKIPILPPQKSINTFAVPMAFPPIPVRYYKIQPIQIYFKRIFDALLMNHTDQLSNWMKKVIAEHNANAVIPFFTDFFAGISKIFSRDFPAELIPILKQLIHDAVINQFPKEAILEENNSLLDKFLLQIYTALVRIIKTFLDDCKKLINDTLHDIDVQLSQVKCKYSEMHKSVSLQKKISGLKTFIQLPNVQNCLSQYEFKGEEKKALLAQKKTTLDILKQLEIDALELFNKKIAEQIPAGQEHLYQISGKSVAIYREEKINEIKARFAEKKSEVMPALTKQFSILKFNLQLNKIEDLLLNPLTYLEFKEGVSVESKLPYVILEFGSTTELHHTKIVGGCSVAFPSVDLKPIPDSKHFIASVLPVMEATEMETFRHIKMGEHSYAVFKLPVEEAPFYSKINYEPFVACLNKETKQNAMDEKEIKAMTRLVSAALAEKKSAKTVTLDTDFNPFACDSAGQTLTHYAASYHPLIGDGWLLYKTCQSNADIFSLRDAHGNLPIHIAAQFGNVEALDYLFKNNKESLEDKNENGLTPFMLAAQSGKTEAVKKLFSLGANPNHRLPNGLFALYLAIQAHASDAALCIIKTNPTSLNFILDSGSSPLHLAIGLKLQDVAIALIQAGADLLLKLKTDSFTPFHLAAEMGLSTICKNMLPRLRDHNMMIANGKTALHLAAEKGHIDTVEILLESKSLNINAKNKEGETALMSALRQGQTETALCLMESKRVSVNLQNNKNESAALIAVKHAQFVVSDKLIEQGENPLLKDENGDNYAYYLLRTGQHLRFQALNLRADSQFHDKTAVQVAMEFEHPLIFEDLVKETKEIKKEEWENQLIFALKADHIGLLKKLTTFSYWTPSYSLKIAYSVWSKTIAYLAAESGSEVCLRWLLSLYDALPKEEKEAVINHAPYRNHLLYGAIMSGKEKIIEMVLPYCEHINIPISENSDCVFASHLVIQSGHFHLIDFLQRRGADFSLIRIIRPARFGKGKAKAIIKSSFHYAIQNDDVACLEKLFSGVPKEKWPDDLYHFALEKQSKRCLDFIYKTHISDPTMSDMIEIKAIVEACQVNDLSEIRKLITHRTKPFTVAKNEDHPLYITAAKGYLTASTLLIHFSDLASQQVALEVALLNNQVDTILFFWKNGLMSHLTPEDLSALQARTVNLYCNYALTGKHRTYDQDKLALIYALEDFDKTTFVKLLKKGLPINNTLYCYKEKRLPLLHCVVAEKAEWAIPILIEHKIDFWQTDETGYTIFQKMIINYEEESKPTPMTSPFQFRKKQIDIGNFGLSNLFNESKFLENRTPEGIEFAELTVIKKHPDAFVNIYTYSNQINSLYFFVKHNNIEAVKTLISSYPLTASRGLDLKTFVNTKRKNNESILMAAAKGGYLHMIKYLLTLPIEVNSLDHQQNSVLHYAIAGGNVEIALKLAALSKKIDQRNGDGLTPFLYAATKGMLSLVKVLANMGVDKNAVDKHGSNALHLAALHGHSAIIAYLSEEMDVDCIQQPLDEKEIRTCLKYTPLHLAAFKGNVSAFSTLIHKGADLLKEDATYRTALEYAVISQQSSLWEFITELKFMHDPEYQSRLFLAASAGENIDALLDLISINSNIHAVNRNGDSALHIACANQKIKAVSLLLDNNIDVNAINAEGETALHTAAEQGFISGIRQLYDANISLDIQNKKGETALHLACKQRHFPVVVQLLKLKVNINLIDHKGFSAVHVALQQEDWQLVALLLACDRNALKSIPSILTKQYEKFLALSVDTRLSDIPEIKKLIVSYSPSAIPSLRFFSKTLPASIKESKEEQKSKTTMIKNRDK